MTSAQLALHRHRTAPIDVPDGFSVLVVGGPGVRLCAAYYLQRPDPFCAGEELPCRRYMGETPISGAGSNTPNHLYSFSFAP